MKNRITILLTALLLAEAPPTIGADPPAGWDTVFTDPPAARGANAPSDSAAETALLQQEEEVPASPPRTTPPRPAQSATQPQPVRAPRRTIRLARVPNMFGDFFPITPSVSFVAPVISPNDPTNPTVLGPVDGEIQDPMFGGGPGLRISENNSAVPQGRVYVNYNYFHNLGRRGLSIRGGESTSVGMYTLGTEVPLIDEELSLELRLPIFESVHGRSSLTDGTGDKLFTENSSSGRLGNLGLVLKQALYENDALLVSGGLGVTLPTGEGGGGTIRRLRYEVRNEAVHLIPWMGVLAAPGERWFTQVFGQLDVAANGYPVQFQSELDPQYPMLSQPERGTFGTYNDPTLLSLDWQTGYWLLRNPSSSCLTGLASVIELRYTTTLKDADRVAGTAGGLAPPMMPPIPGTEINFLYTSPAGRYDVLNLTVGLHAVIHESLRIRIAESLPLRGDDRAFDAETLVQVDLRY